MRAGGGGSGGNGLVAVIGSCNVDLVVRVPHLPARGETVLGGDLVRLPGGKGANQAVAAARLGASVTMVGAVGTDEAGTWLLAALAGDGIDLRHLVTLADVPTGAALIAVDREGHNSIVVSPGANARVTASVVDEAAAAISEAAVAVAQLEVPDEAVAAARTHARYLVLNPAPARPLPPTALAVELCVPNAVELGQLLGVAPPRSVAEAVHQGRRLVGPAAVVVTLGAVGAVVITADRYEVVPAPVVEAVDTTAAGDTLCGALAAALADGATLVEATRFGVVAASVSVTRHGAQPSIPRRHEIPPLP